jgi:hypothetical protein
MATVEELLKQKQEIEAALEEAMKREREDVVRDVRKKIKDYNITATELRGVIKTRKRTAKAKDSTES